MADAEGEPTTAEVVAVEEGAEKESAPAEAEAAPEGDAAPAAEEEGATEEDAPAEVPAAAEEAPAPDAPAEVDPAAEPPAEAPPPEEEAAAPPVPAEEAEAAPPPADEAAPAPAVEEGDGAGAGGEGVAPPAAAAEPSLVGMTTTDSLPPPPKTGESVVAVVIEGEEEGAKRAIATLQVVSPEPEEGGLLSARGVGYQPVGGFRSSGFETSPENSPGANGSPLRSPARVGLEGDIPHTRGGSTARGFRGITPQHSPRRITRSPRELYTAGYPPESREGVHVHTTPASLNVRSMSVGHRDGRLGEPGHQLGSVASRGSMGGSRRFKPTTARDAAVSEGVGGGGGAGRFPADKWLPDQPMAQDLYDPVKDLANWNLNGGRERPTHTVYHSTFYSLDLDQHTWRRPQQSFAVAPRFSYTPRDAPDPNPFFRDPLRGDLDYEAADAKAGLSRRERLNPYRFTVSSMRSTTGRFGPPSMQGLRGGGSTGAKVGPGRYSQRGQFGRAPGDPVPVAQPLSSMMASGSPRVGSEWLPNMSAPSGASLAADDRDRARAHGAGRFGHKARVTDMAQGFGTGSQTPGSAYYEIHRWPKAAPDIVHRGFAGFYSDHQNPLTPRLDAMRQPTRPKGTPRGGGGGSSARNAPRGRAVRAMS